MVPLFASRKSQKLFCCWLMYFVSFLTILQAYNKMFFFFLFSSRTRDSTVASGISSLTVATGSNGEGRESQSLILDIRKEKRSQRFLVLVVSVYFASLLPLNVLKIVRQVVTETYDNEHDFDITYIIIVWLAFLPTVIIPWFVAHWLLIGSWRKDRFVPYLRNGNSSQQHILNGKIIIFVILAADSPTIIPIRLHQWSTFTKDFTCQQSWRSSAYSPIDHLHSCRNAP